MRTLSPAWHIPLALVTGAALASNPRLFPADGVTASSPAATSAISVTRPSPEITAGLVAPKGAESPELRALRMAEEQFFDGTVSDDSAPGWDFDADAGDDRPRAAGAAAFLEGLVLPELGVPAHASVQKYVQYFTRDPQGRGMLRSWLERSGKYDEVITSALSSQGLPADLKAIVFIESGFWPTAKSEAGAVGLWQFMPATARAYGLTVNKHYDERRSIWRSSEAAAKHLGDLHARFNSWDLVLAAYNYGYRNVEHSLESADTSDFWTLADSPIKFPEETRRYVPKVMAVAVVLKNLDHFGFGDVVQQPGLEAAAFEAPAGTSLKTLARAAGMSAAALKQLNPEFLSAIVPDRGSPVALHIPRGSLSRARAMLPQLLGGPLHELDEQVSDRFDWGRDTPSADGRSRLELTHAPSSRRDPTEVVQRGKPIACSSETDETPQLSRAPDNEGEQLSSLVDSLSIPPAVTSEHREAQVDARAVSAKATEVTFLAYRVAHGDTLTKIAKRHRVSEQELVLDNGIRNRSLLFRGQELRVRDAQASPLRPFLSYKVRPGDTLSAIAIQVQADAQRIAKANGIDDSDLIRVGQVVLISPG